MVSQCKRTNHGLLFTGMAALAATLMLAACGGGGPERDRDGRPHRYDDRDGRGDRTSERPANRADADECAYRHRVCHCEAISSDRAADAVASVAAAATKPAAPNANAGSVAGKVHRAR